MFKTILPALVFLSLLTGCAATGPLFNNAVEIPRGRALVYVYRPHTLALSAVKASFSIDEELVVKVRDSGYSPLLVAPGTHNIKQTWDVGFLHESGLADKPLRVTVSLNDGQTVYLRLSSYSGSYSSDSKQYRRWEWQLEEVPAELARKEIAITHLERP